MSKIKCKLFGHKWEVDKSNSARKYCKRNCGASQFLMQNLMTGEIRWDTYWIADKKIK